MQSVIRGRSIERSEMRRPGIHAGTMMKPPRCRIIDAKLWKDFLPGSIQAIVFPYATHFLTLDLSTSFEPRAYFSSQIRFQTGSLVRTGDQGEASASGLVALR